MTALGRQQFLRPRRSRDEVQLPTEINHLQQKGGTYAENLTIGHDRHLPFYDHRLWRLGLPQHGFARCCGGWVGRGCRDLVKDVLLDHSQLGDLSGELIDALPHRIEINWGGRDDFVFRVWLPSDSGKDTNKKRDQVASEC
jgi:hypothetical protein